MHVFSFVIIVSLIGILQQVLADADADEDGDRFSCVGRVAGFYADIASDCKEYHACTGTATYTYICPNSTRFSQNLRICQPQHLVNCALSQPLPDRAKKTKNSAFPTTQRKITHLLESTTSKGFPKLTTSRSSFSTRKSLITTEAPTLTQRINPVVGNDKIKPLAGPSITLNELLEKLYGGSYADKGRGMKLDWVLPDVRAMFYIPDNQQDNVAPNIKRFSLIIPESKMIFKSKQVKHKNKLLPF